jgi:enoyl-CoA hydratase
LSKFLLYERRGAAVWLTLNRPKKLNALNASMIGALRDALRRARTDDEVKVVVLTGAGRAFSAGYDLDEDFAKELRGAEAFHDSIAEVLDLTLELWTLPRPTIAAVSGWCLASGFELAMACDMVVAGESARFGEPGIRYGSGPGVLLLPFLIGDKKANELLFTGVAIDAAEAGRVGLVNRVVPDGHLEDTVEELVAKIAPTPLPVLRLTKLALKRAHDARGFREALNANHDVTAILDAADTSEQRDFRRIAETEGLKAALAWRDSRYGQLLR